MTRALAALLAALTLVGAAAAATIRGTARGDRINAVNDRRQTVLCGRGNDVVNADAVDTVRADCERVARRVGVDRTNVAGAQHSTVVEPDSFAFGSTVVAVYQAGRISGGGSGATGWASSLDSGRTWRSGTLPGVGHASDPSIAYDAAHAVWLAVTLGITDGPTSIDVSRSPEGRRWAAPIHALEAPVQTYDKEWVVCDNAFTSPRRGTCYIAYTDFRRERIAAVASTDGGLTWSAPAYLPRGQIVGAQPIVLPDGTLVVAWLDRDSLVAARSRDGAASFDSPVFVAQIDVPGVAGFRAPPLPSIEVDRNGRILLAWPDCRFRRDCGGTDIVVSASRDGLTWTTPARVTRGSGSYLVPGIAADPESDALAVVATVVLPGACCRVGVVLVRSSDGVNWSSPRRLDATTMRFAWLAQAGRLAFLGDYLSASWVGGRPIGFVPLARRPQRGVLRQSLYAGTTR